MNLVIKLSYNIFVSLIVPVFNIEKKLLIRCLDSLIYQSLKNIEIVVVDDASTNSETLRVLNEYHLKYCDKINLIVHNVNKKQGGARNTGLRAAKGVFIGFVDSDDYIHEDMYKLLYEKAIQDNADIVDCDYKVVDYEGKLISEEISINKKKSKNQKLLNSGRIVTKLYKKNMILKNEVFFPEKMVYEDMAIWGLHIFYAKKISKINKYLYFYVKNNNSTVMNCHVHMDDKLKAGEIFYNTMKCRGIIDEYKEEVLIMYFDIYFKSTYRLLAKHKKNYFNIIINIIDTMNSKGIDLTKKNYLDRLNLKQKIELNMIIKLPLLYKIYVYIKYNKYQI